MKDSLVQSKDDQAGYGTEITQRRVLERQKRPRLRGWAAGLVSRGCDDPKMTRSLTPAAFFALVNSACMPEK
jgi:hypothetical protein